MKKGVNKNDRKNHKKLKTFFIKIFMVDLRRV